MLNFWWILSVGTMVLLLFAAGYLAVLFAYRRESLRLWEEKLALAEKEEKRYSDLFNTVSDLVYVHSLGDGIVLQVNSAVTQILGYESPEIIGRPLRELLGARRYAAVEEYLRRLDNGQGEISAILPIPKKGSGELVLLEYRSTVVRENDDRVARGVARDVTAQKRSEYALRKEIGRAHV